MPGACDALAPFTTAFQNNKYSNFRDILTPVWPLSVIRIFCSLSLSPSLSLSLSLLDWIELHSVRSNLRVMLLSLRKMKRVWQRCCAIFSDKQHLFPLFHLILFHFVRCLFHFSFHLCSFFFLPFSISFCFLCLFHRLMSKRVMDVFTVIQIAQATASIHRLIDWFEIILLWVTALWANCSLPLWKSAIYCIRDYLQLPSIWSHD